MAEHHKKEKKLKRCLIVFHACCIGSFTILCLIGLRYFLVSCVAFLLMILISLSVYLYGLKGIRELVIRFELTLPNERVTCLHFTNMLLFVIVSCLMTITELLMLQMFEGLDKN